ncbi:hypothetical protein Fmac_030527 [Flemingia macrophylla]|uniref:Uncharacterized protein n=1 Tax=Flemingia macrophylla TaxID=520843 RepID=A0ABD1KZG2_9FABA
MVEKEVLVAVDRATEGVLHREDHVIDDPELHVEGVRAVTDVHTVNAFGDLSGHQQFSGVKKIMM